MKTCSECRASRIPRDMWAQVKVTLLQRGEMKELRARGLTYKEIGTRFEVTPSTARYICLGIKDNRKRPVYDRERKRKTRLKSWYRRKEIVNLGEGQYTGWQDKRHSNYSVSKWINPITEQVYNEFAEGLEPCRVLFKKAREEDITI